MNTPNNNRPLNRRRFLQTSAAASASLLLSACITAVPAVDSEALQPASETSSPPTAEAIADPAGTATPPPVDTPILEATPQCDDGDDETLAQTEGPFYTPSTPERTSLLEPGITGTPLVLTGKVLRTNCEPISAAMLDFWHADDAGQYDNVGYRLRGHQFTDEDGNYRLETIVPGLYPGRTRHIHVKVQGADTSLLTTQLYFPDEPDNQRDGIFHPLLLMTVIDNADGKEAAFDFVLG